MLSCGLWDIVRKLSASTPVIVECLECSVWLLGREQIRREGCSSGSPAGEDHERMMAELEQGQWRGRQWPGL